MEQILLVVHVIIAAALIGMVLIQRSETDGFGLGSGGGSNLLSGRATANLLTRTTGILAGLFIVNSLILSILASNHRAPSIVDAIEDEQTKAAFSAPAVPNAGADKSEKAKVDRKESKAGLPPVEQTIIPATDAKPVVKHKAKPAESTTDEAPAVPTPAE